MSRFDDVGGYLAQDGALAGAEREDPSPESTPQTSGL